MGRISLTTDIWLDLQLVAFMAVTAHWIEEKAEDTPDGARKKLTLCSALIGFHLVPKGHDGKQLAHILFSVVERVQILGKVSEYNNVYSCFLEITLSNRLGGSPWTMHLTIPQ
jgi:hypothetical protein